MRVALGLILTLAACLRFTGIGFGLPETMHADEMHYVYAGLMSLAHGFRAEQALEGNVIPTTTAVLTGAAYVVLRLGGRVPDGGAVIDAILADPTWLWLALRVLNALASLAAIALVAVLGGRLFGERVGLVAALFLACCFTDALEAHFLVGHSIAACGITAALLTMLTGSSVRRALAAGVAFGIAAATKTHALAFAPAVALAAATGAPDARAAVRALAGLAAGAVAGFLLGTPGFVFAPVAFLESVFAHVRNLRGGGWVDTGGLPATVFFAVYLLPGGLGWPVWALALAGWVHALARPTRVRLIVALAPLPVALALAPGFARYALAVLPWACLLAATFFVGLTDRLPRPVFWVALALTVATPLARTVKMNRLLRAPDTRLAARAWFEAHVPPGARVTNEGMESRLLLSRVGVPLRPSRKHLQPQLDDAQKEGHGGRFLEALARRGDAGPAYAVRNVVRLDEDAQAFDAEVVVTMNWMPRRARRETYYEPAVQARLDAEFALVKAFRPHPELRHDPLTWLVDFPALDALSLFDDSLVLGPDVRVYRRR